MKDLKFSKPYRLTTSRIEDGKYLEHPDNTHYGRFSTVSTKQGLVTVSELDWAHNNGKTVCTYFRTVIKGMCFSACLEEAQLSDRRIKHMATMFINRIIKELNKQIAEMNK